MRKILLFFILTFPVLLFSQKNDTVYLLNGDRITGEIKKFEYGILTLKTDAMQTVSIEYDRIFTVYAGKFFEIRSSNGILYYGSLAKSKVPGIINLADEKDTIPKPIVDIVQITSIKNKFWQRLDGSVDVGLNYTKASSVMQFNLSSNVSYRTTRYLSEFELNSIITDQPEKSVSRKNDVSLNINRILEGPWFAGVQIGANQNTELNLDHRYQAGAGAGYDIVHTNSNRLSGLAGVLVNSEKTIDTQEESINSEGFVSIQYKWFKYNTPKIDLTSVATLFPSLNVKKRYRFNYNLQAKFEIIKDLFFGVTLYDNFDSKPSENENSKNDWGVITSIGYSF